MVNSCLKQDEIDALIKGRHADPFAVLGLQSHEGQRLARAFVPGAEAVTASNRDGTVSAPLTKIHDEGLFEGPIGLDPGQPIILHAQHKGDVWSFWDPYSFGPVLGPMDDYYLTEGTHLRLYDKLGAHLISHEGVQGVHFAVWAPNAQRVSVVGDFNGWNGLRHVMRKRLGTGIFEIFIPDVAVGSRYKYEIIGASGELLPLKADPFAFQAELRPATASRVARIDDFVWTDQDYLNVRKQRDARRQPISIYEVHAGSWRRKDNNEVLSYDELAEELIPYVVSMGFTHIELLPMTEYPYDPSWGYQPTGLFAPTARYGDPHGFARLINAAHEAGIGVIMDWVPAHFPLDDFGLAHFDGTALYEHRDPREGFHPDWHTAIYNFGRTEVQSFLINNALFWLEKYHIDGLRVDAVASMLYRDYSRKAGEWVPNAAGGNENLEAIAFLRRLNEVCYGAQPGVLMIAEESTAFPGVTQPTYAGGIGFGFKWNLGFMHDTLGYLARDPLYRHFHHNELTFGLLYAFSENFILPLSHDEVVHGKGSLLKKMGGDDWAKFAALRAYFAFMWAYPGKKLLFMGQELAPWDEWSEERSLDWHLAHHGPHQGMQQVVRDLNHLYKELPSLHGRDCEAEGFEWLIVDDNENSVYAWIRRAGSAAPIIIVVNFTPVPRYDYKVPMPLAGQWRERFNSDAKEYDGSGIGNAGLVEAYSVHDGRQPAEASLTLPPMAALILEYQR